MLDVRFDDCGGPYDLTADHTITSWESLPTSGAELAMMAYLQAEPSDYFLSPILKATKEAAREQ